MTLFRKSLLAATAGASIAALVAGVAQAQSNTADFTPEQLNELSTPEGITLQPLGKGQGWDLGKETASVVYRDEIAYTDPTGLTLYTYDKDPAGQATCVAECAETFRPAAPPADAKPFGDWSIIQREDGSRQWAVKGKALYTYKEDVDPGSLFGNNANRFGAQRTDRAGNVVGGGIRGGGSRNASKDKPAPKDWQAALMYPARNMLETPPGFTISEVLDAHGLILVDHRGRTTYTFEGSAEAEKAAVAGGQFVPVAAPQLAYPQGDFAIVQRDDGVSQWAYQGKALYTYADDMKVGDAYGVGKGWEAAAVRNHFMPDGITFQRTASQGLVLATADGKTIYKRDGHIYQSGGGHSLHRGQPARPAVGRDIGADARCDADCAKVWHPLRAPEDAQPQGYWNVVTRDDGTKQWTYHDYALWTYDGDKKPGDMLGHDTYNMEYAMDKNTLIDVGTPMDGIATLVWSVVNP